jgi:transposase InsO family protein
MQLTSNRDDDENAPSVATPSASASQASASDGVALPRQVPSPAARLNRLDIPANIRNTIQACHNGVVGHFGLDRTLHYATLKLTAERTPIPDQLKDYVQQFIRTCPACQKNTYRQPPHGVTFNTSSMEPMCCIATDLLGPFPTDANNCAYVVTIIDTFSRYVQLVPADEPTAQEVAKALLRHASYFGFPQLLRSDNGSHFVNKLIEELSRLTGMDLQRIVAYSHEENGIVERAHREVLRHLRNILYERTTRENWSLCLPLIQRIMNATVHSTIGVAPAQVITPGLDLNGGLLFPRQEIIPMPGQEYLNRLFQLHAQIVRSVQKELHLREHQRPTLQPSERTAHFPVGSYVVLARPRDTFPKEKHEAVYRGPYLVDAYDGQNTYTIRNLITDKAQKVNVSRLRPFYFDNQSEDPKDVARRDYQEFVIDRILDHTGDSSRPSALQFKVRWLGFDAEDDTWEPWHNLRNSEALHLYLQANGLSKLIPAEHRNNHYLSQ